jgi:3-hydroxyacyl-[acyl-carrier-protein] dehydratase
MSDATPGIERTINITTDNPVFEGHFPGFPIYPGVSQIQDVCDTLSGHFGQTVNLVNISRTKFLSFVTPPATLHVVCRVDNQNISWDITRDGKTVCVGRGIARFTREITPQ